MAQHFFGNSGSMALQSTPKAAHQHSSAKVPDDGFNSTGETLSFVSLDDSNEQHSEDSGIGVSKTSTRGSPGNSDMEEAAVLTPTSSRIDEVGKKAQDLIERINERRAMDQHVMNSFEEKLIKKLVHYIRATLNLPSLGAGEGDGATGWVVLGPGLHAAWVTAVVWFCQSETA
uniref:Synaptonemal complex central element protein 2 n=1 Tax=Cyprinus carpio carpio TaxID=630221 RepID=A0A8C1GZH6_CYPCA